MELRLLMTGNFVLNIKCHLPTIPKAPRLFHWSDATFEYVFESVFSEILSYLEID